MEREKFEPPLAAASEPEPPRGVGGVGAAAVASAPVPGGWGGGVSSCLPGLGDGSHAPWFSGFCFPHL